jgi:putative tryptophan/tyrosine transport system substrate-binding protein
MKKTAMPSILVAVMLAVAVLAEAQQGAKVPRIGVLTVGTEKTTTSLKAFSQRLHELGYLEGKNIVVEYRYAEGKLERLPDLAAELVRSNVAVIVTSGTPATQAAKQATSTIPIVVGTAGDLVGVGLVASLAKPGGNVTGLTAISPDLSGKRLELLTGVLPRSARIAVLWYPSQWDDMEVKQTENVAQVLGVQIQLVQVRRPEDFQSAYATMIRERARAVIIIQTGFTGTYRTQLLELAAKNRLASMCDSPAWADDGCLMSYGPNRSDLYRRAATYVDKILKGAKPADLPVEQPKKFELIINLKAAKQIGLTIPPNVLARADRVIK